MSLLLVVDSAVVDWTDDHLVLAPVLLVLDWTDDYLVLLSVLLVLDWTDDHLVLLSVLLVLDWTDDHPVLVALSHLMSDDHLITNGAVLKSQCDATGLGLPVNSE